MGGATITHNGTKEEILAFMKDQIKTAAERGLYPDSALAIIDPINQKATLYKVDIDPTGIVTFTETPEGPIFHVGVAARFNPTPKPGELTGTVHVGS